MFLLSLAFPCISGFFMPICCSRQIFPLRICSIHMCTVQFLTTPRRPGMRYRNDFYRRGHARVQQQQQSGDSM
ncbi:hypothetical protein F4802DRAFT_568236, partial [Xylaria palmicola]